MPANEFLQLVVAALLSGTVVSAVLGLLLQRRTTTLTEEISSEFDQRLEVFRSGRTWRERSVSELLGPVYMQLDRTERAFRRWEKKNLYLEAKVIRDGNLRVRDLLLTNADLIPPELLEDAGKLIEHYDRWLEQFEEVRQGANPQTESPFVFVGPQGYPFPRTAAERFQDAFRSRWNELYREPS